MIIWFNCKITDVRPNPQPRYNLRNDNRFDIARYSFASYAPLEPLVSKFIFNLEMADGHAGQEAEMEAWLKSIFPEEKLVLNWYRCNHPSQWHEMQRLMDSIGDDIVYPAGNEDHIFMDSDIETMAKGIELLKQSSQANTVLGISHYPESIRSAFYYNPNQAPVNTYLSLTMGNNDSIRIMKREFLDWYVAQIQDPNMFVFRTEQWNSITLPTNIILVPTKEQFRHFDGYAHVKVSPDIAPPLEIPPGFFEKKMVIKYGFSERDPDCVNINPMAEHLYAADPNGTDYKFTLNDIPAFWKPYIEEIIVADNIDHQAMTEARDKYYMSLTKVEIDWYHVGVKLDKTNEPPLQWIQPHMIVTEFVETAQ